MEMLEHPSLLTCQFSDVKVNILDFFLILGQTGLSEAIEHSVSWVVLVCGVWFHSFFMLWWLFITTYFQMWTLLCMPVVHFSGSGFGVPFIC